MYVIKYYSFMFVHIQECLKNLLETQNFSKTLFEEIILQTSNFYKKKYYCFVWKKNNG